MISQEAIQKILGIKEEIYTTAEKMAEELNITFFPYISPHTDPHLIDFANKLRQTLVELRVNIIPYKLALKEVLFRKRIKKLLLILLNNISYLLEKYILRKPPASIYINSSVIKNILKSKRIKRGISVIAVGENETGNLPMDNTSSFRESSVITILNLPPHINTQSDFNTHFNTAISLFAYHMTNIVIGVGKREWILYNFNASHPIYDIKKDFKENILHALIPKIAAPIRAHSFSDFIIQEETFNINDAVHAPLVEDIIESGGIFDKTGLYPKSKRIDELNFRNKYYYWIGQIHLDNRNGMSYGFLARQLPTVLFPLIPLIDAQKKYGSCISTDHDWFICNGVIFVTVKLSQGTFCMKIPEVWVLSQRSGSDKTHLNPQSDLIKLGLKNGNMYLQTPIGTKLNKSFKPSFDTKVILAHAVGNAIIASIINHLSINYQFPNIISKQGFALSHWHGYFNQHYIPKGLRMYGMQNPHVACSSPQSALYALKGKLDVFGENNFSYNNYLGDIHVEPHHGINVSFPTLKGLATYLMKYNKASCLGNKYHP
jgi:hypothetical protein